MNLRLTLFATLAALPALAWDPTTPASVQVRIAELQQAWQGKSPEQIAQDKVARSRQPRPQWVGKTTWKVELGPVTYYFGVGKSAVPAAAPAAAGTGPVSPSPAATAGRPLDWWYDDAAGVFYTLVVDAR